MGPLRWREGTLNRCHASREDPQKIVRAGAALRTPGMGFPSADERLDADPFDDALHPCSGARERAGGQLGVLLRLLPLGRAQIRARATRPVLAVSKRLERFGRPMAEDGPGSVSMPEGRDHR